MLCLEICRNIHHASCVNSLPFHSSIHPSTYPCIHPCIQSSFHQFIHSLPTHPRSLQCPTARIRSFFTSPGPLLWYSAKDKEKWFEGITEEDTSRDNRLDNHAERILSWKIEMLKNTVRESGAECDSLLWKDAGKNSQTDVEGETDGW